ncbi:MAG: DUF882 domain-containing protein [Myxococcota bacterium]|nr:DUF882 domain-containing protein [Myxococcota bacterium]
MWWVRRMLSSIRGVSLALVCLGGFLGCGGPQHTTSHRLTSVELRHIHTNERLDLQVSAAPHRHDERASFGQHPERIEAFFRDWRSQREHAIHPRLLSCLVKIAQHFGQPIEIVSAYRSGARKTSRHRHGKAIDFRVRGVEPQAIWQYAQRFSQVGLGLYPASGFVHIDIRRRSYYWIDDSGPGEPSRYRPGVPQPRLSLNAR